MIDSIRAKRIYSDMNRIRSFEERTVRLFEEDKLRGSVHLYIGEEAIAATICSHLTDDDYITGTHRGMVTVWRKAHVWTKPWPNLGRVQAIVRARRFYA